MSETIPDIERTLGPQIAAMSLALVPVEQQKRKIKEEFKVELTNRQYNKIKDSDTCQLIMSEATEKMKKIAISELARMGKDLLPLVESTLRTALEDGQLGAVPHVFKMVGLDGKTDDKPVQAQQIVVQLPGVIKDVSPKD